MRKLEKTKKQEALKVYFEVKSQLAIPISTTYGYWDVITQIKHTSLRGKEGEVKEALINPDEVRVSKRAKDIFLFYKKTRKVYLCAVARVFKRRGFIVTAYYTKKIKEGRLKWKR